MDDGYSGISFDRPGFQSMLAEIEAQRTQAENLERYIRTIRRYDELDHLTPYAARELIHAVRAGKAEKIDGKRHQEIRIDYDLVGFIPINELLKAVQAA